MAASERRGGKRVTGPPRGMRLRGFAPRRFWNQLVYRLLLISTGDGAALESASWSECSKRAFTYHGMRR